MLATLVHLLGYSPTDYLHRGGIKVTGQFAGHGLTSIKLTSLGNGSLRVVSS